MASFADDPKGLDGSSDDEFERSVPQTSGLQRGSTVEFSYRTLKTMIINGEISPGQRLIEEGVARNLGVSRTPVRQAIHRLEAEGLIQRTPGYGAIITQLTDAQIEDVYVARAVLEGLAARLAAQIMLPRDYTKLEIVQKRLEAATHDHDTATLASINFQFHAHILRAARNGTVTVFMGQIHDSIKRLEDTTMSYPGRAEAALEEHRELIEAIASRQAERAEQIARNHIDNALHIRLLMNADKEIEALD